MRCTSLAGIVSCVCTKPGSSKVTENKREEPATRRKPSAHNVSKRQNLEVTKKMSIDTKTVPSSPLYIDIETCPFTFLFANLYHAWSPLRFARPPQSEKPLRGPK